MHKIFKLFILFYCGYSSATTLNYKQVAEGTFEVILENEVPLEIGQAQSVIYSAAVQLCKGKNPLFGRYSFNGSQPISQNAKTSSFTFQQEIKCTENVAVVEPPKKLDLTNKQEEAMRSIAKKMTEEFLSFKESGEFGKAYDMLGSDMKKLFEFSSWRRKESDYFGDKLGELESRDIWRITLYNNPPNSPKPGLYIATDYENSYANSPIHCGYVIWFLPAVSSDEFTVMREEYGNITAEMLEKIPADNLQNVREQIGCRPI